MNLLPIAAVFIFMVPILLIAGLIKRLGKRSDFYEYIILSSGSVLLSILLYLGLYAWVKRQSAFDAVWNSFRQDFLHGPIGAEQVLSIYHQLGFFENFTTGGQLADFLIGQMKMVVPAGILLFSLVYGVIVFLVTRLIMKRLGFSVCAVRAFEDWALPRRMAFGLIILLLISFLAGSLGIARFEVIRYTIAVLISFLFTVLGLSVLWFFLKAGRVPSVFRWLLTILAFLVAGFALPFLGLLDQLVLIRLRYKKRFVVKNEGQGKL